MLPRNAAVLTAMILVFGFVFAETIIIQNLGGPENKPITIPITMLIAGIAGWHLTNIGRLLERKEK